MTLLCGGGTSSARPIAPSVVFLSGEALVALLTEGLGTPIWADLVAFVGSQTFTFSTLCATDPPSMPSFSAGDILDIVQGNPFAPGVGQGKLVDLITIAAWHVFCQCDSGSTPTPPVAPTRPAGGVTVNPPVVPPQTGPACLHVQTGVDDINAQYCLGTINPVYEFTQLIMGGLPAQTVASPLSCTGSNPTVARQLPTGAQTMRFTMSNISLRDSTHYADLQLVVWAANGTTALANTVVVSTKTGVATDFTYTLPSGATYVMVFSSETASLNNISYSLEVTIACSAGPQLVQPCCPPDPVLLGRLESLSQMLNAIYEALPASVNSYAESTHHAGLTGGGTITLGAGTIAAKVSITADTSGLPTAAGVPTFLFDRGYIVPVTLEAPIRSQVRLVYNPQLYQLPPLTEALGYQLAGGVTAEVIELTRGP